ncbi:MAG: peptidase inhibitor family I36 protein [Vicinamibacterales bacterium]
MRRFVGATGIALALAGCGSLPALGPTPTDQGIIIYLNADYAGPAQALNADVPDLGKVQGSCSSGAEGEAPTWSDCISSVRVLPGWSATLYRDSNYKGASVTLTADAANLRDVAGPCDKDSFNDCVSSIRVARR